VRHPDLTNHTTFGLVQACLEAEVPPGLVANVFLYYWLRASTINANVPEPFFQTLERHWDMVVIHSYRHRHGNAPGDPRFDEVERVSAGAASPGVPRVPLLRPGRPADLRALPRVLAGWPQAPQRGGVPGGVALSAPHDPSAMGVRYVRFFLVFPRAR
jgi:hypothetical protein